MADRTSRSRILPALAFAAACAAGVAGLYCWCVRTESGQRLDIAGMVSARLGASVSESVASRVLNTFSTVTIAILALIIVAIAVLRRRPMLAVGTVILMGGAVATTQVLKRWVFDRPDLNVTDIHANSLPSGHTTVAAAMAAALVLAVGTRARPWVAIGAVVYSAGTGLATLVMSWHRPSDIIAALLVTGAWAAIVVAIGAGIEADVPIQPAGAASAGRIIPAIMAVAGGLSLAVAGALGLMLMPGLPTGIINSLTNLGRSQSGQAYTMSLAAIIGTALVVFAALVALVPRSRSRAGGARLSTLGASQGG